MIVFTHRFCLILAITCCLVSQPAMSEEEAAEEGPWSGKIALGYSAVDGNTDTESLAFDAEVNYDAVKWHHTLIGKAIRNEANNVVNAETYKVSWVSKYDFSERFFGFGQLDYNKDKFSSYKRQTFQIVGLGYRFIDTEKHKLNGEIGAGAGQSKLIDGTDQDEFTGRVSGDYTWQISENASFVQKLSVSTSSSNMFSESLTELRAGIIGSLNLVLSYGIQRNSDVLPGTEKTDTYTTISLEYAF